MSAPADTPIPIVLCIDAEPDAIFPDPDRPAPWQGFERAIDFFAAARRRLAAAADVPVRFAWFVRMDPLVEKTYGRSEWAGIEYGQRLKALVDDGDEVGLHVHAHRWDVTRRGWIVDHGDESWTRECLEAGVSGFERSIGRRPAVFRFGDRWLSQDTVRTLQRLGVRCDATIEPGHPAIESFHRPGRATGSLPDYTGAPSRLYRPSKEDYRVPSDAPGSGDLWMLPVTTARARAGLARRLHSRTSRREVVAGVWTAFANHDRLLFRRIVEARLARPDPLLVLPLRTDVLLSARRTRRLSANLRWLQSHPLAHRFEWTTPIEAIERRRPAVATGG